MTRDLVALIVRSRAFRRCLTPLFVSALLGAIGASALGALRPSTEQSAQDAFGGADGAVTLLDQPPLGTTGSDGPPFDGAGEVATPVLTSWVTWKTGDRSGALYREHPQPSVATQGKLELVSGRWAKAPGEVVLTGSARAELGTDLTPLLGTWHLRVVGEVVNPHSRDTTAVYGAPGTWLRWHASEREISDSGISAQKEILWRSPDPEQTATRLAEELGATGEVDTRERYVTRLSGFSAKRTLETTLPFTILLLLGGLVTGGLAAALARRIVMPLADLGLPAASARRAVLGALAAGGGIALALGALLALIALVPIRLVLASQVDHPLSPWQFPAIALAVGVASLASAMVVASAFMRLRGHRRAVLADRSWISLRALPALGAVALVVAVSTWALGVSGFRGLLLIVGASCIGLGGLSPLILRALTSITREPGVTLAVLRFTRSRLPVFSLQVALVGTLISLTATTLSLAAGATAQLNRVSSTGIPPGMVLLHQDLGDRVMSSALITTFVADLGLQDFTRARSGVGSTTEEFRPYWAFDSAADISSVFGPLSKAQAATLATEGELGTVAESPDGVQEGRAPEQAASADAIVVPWDLRWLKAVTIDTRVAAGERVLIFTNLSPAQDRRAAGWTDARGVDPAFVQATSRADPLPIPLMTQLSTGLFGIVIALMSYLLLRRQIEPLRPLLAGMVASGLGVGWLRRVVLGLALMVSVVAGVSALIATALAVVLGRSAVGSSFLLTDLPWVGIGAILLGSVLGGVTGGGLAARRLRESERRE